MEVFMQVPREHLKPVLQPLYDYLDLIGGYSSSSVASGSAVALTSTTAANVTSISLSEGEWDVSGVVGYLPAASTSITVLNGGASTTSATVGTTGAVFNFSQAAVVPGAVGQEFSIPTSRIVVAAGSTTTVYLVARATFTISTLGAYGTIRARRVSK
jgi:hypothetical protein